MFSQWRNDDGFRGKIIFIVGVALVVMLGQTLRVLAAQPATYPFQDTWQRPDQPVLTGQVSRTWMWGPEAFTDTLTEAYADSPGGTRTTQYFDKARMEDNGFRAVDPWDVTNGLLVVELLSGRMQLGDNAFEQRERALVNVAGDTDDANGITYAALAGLRDATPLADGAAVIQRIDRAGNVTADPALDAYGVTAAEHVIEPGIDHQIASPFWACMNSSDIVYVDGSYLREWVSASPALGSTASMSTATAMSTSPAMMAMAPSSRS